MTPEATEKLGFCSVMVASTPVEPDKAEVPIASSPSPDPASIRLAPAVSRAFFAAVEYSTVMEGFSRGRRVDQKDLDRKPHLAAGEGRAG